MTRIVLSLTMALLVALGSACAKSTSQSASQKGNSRPRRTAEERFAQLDVNKDGKLSMQEFRGHATQPDQIAILDKWFNEADTNHDGFLSLDEYKAYLERGRGGGRGFGRY